ncbi:MAG: sugar ABC transporter permease [Anaerolineales bacterium]|nr:sugar ABC transporter permease [Anaerolineales bacterium]
MKQLKIKKDYYGYLFIAPFVIGFLIFSLYPVYNTFFLSFTNTTLLPRNQDWVGFDNFIKLPKDPLFLKAIKNTWTLWLVNFIPQMGIALLISTWFTSTRLKIKGVGVWRALFYLPNLLMPAAIAALFFSLFSYYGPVNQALVRTGLIPEAIQYLQKETVARGLVVFIQWWMWWGQTVIIVMAGMTSIPLQLYEAAMVDGASTWQMFRWITIPLLKPIILYIFVTSLVGGMQMFDIPYLLTDGRGAPGGSILTSIVLMMMKFRTSKGHIGLAATVGVAVFVMTTVCALALFYLLRDKDAIVVEKQKKAELKARKAARKEMVAK